ncbi:MAG: division/cell wall cluster transcriptional repressor MraZ [Salinisphaeraceae bacterium]|nr:division/cell wall cluster transcriptional repressor MraZ [Salinisphaeraceae bacterium]
MFLGADPITIDEKGRFAVPARYRVSLREQCNGQLVVVPHHRDPCLLILPRPGWMAFAEKLTAKAALSQAVRDMQRRYIARARDLEMDKQGRLLLPAPVRVDAGLNSKATLAGVGNSLELWDEAAWQAEQDRIAGSMAALADEDLAQGLEDLSF